MLAIVIHLCYDSFMEELEGTPQEIDASREVIPRGINRQQVMRLVRLATNFDAEVAKLPNGQKYIEAQREIAEKRRRAQNNPDLLNMRLD
jgi:hypothetical protein